MQSKSTQEITLRFARALKAVSENKWGVKKAFFEKYNIPETNLYRVMREYETQKLDPGWIAALVMEFNISAIWILTGQGEMFAKKTDEN